MKILLEFFLRYFDFLYLDSNYRITDSTTSGNPLINASLKLVGPVIAWDLSNDRGQIRFVIAPTKSSKTPENWFRVPLIRQYLDGYDEMNYASPEETVVWARENLPRLEQLFSDPETDRSCQELHNFAKALAVKYFGAPEKE
jgi:hypothetical protein